VKRTRRTEVTIETDEITIIRRQGECRSIACRRCGDEMAMVAPERAAAMFLTSVRAIYRWVEEGVVHYDETRGGWPVVCRDSVRAAVTGSESATIHDSRRATSRAK
jgi:hypothetical protein